MEADRNRYLRRDGDRTMNLKVTIKKGEAGYYVANCPALRGCWSQGKTEDEALANIREAIEGWLEVEEEKVARAARGHRTIHSVQV